MLSIVKWDRSIFLHSNLLEIIEKCATCFDNSPICGLEQTKKQPDKRFLGKWNYAELFRLNIMRTATLNCLTSTRGYRSFDAAVSVVR